MAISTPHRLSLVAALVLAACILSYPRSTTAARGFASANLDDHPSQWRVYIDPPGRFLRSRVAGVATPSLDGRSLRIALLGGQPYTGLHVYDNMPPIPRATIFHLDLWFRFAPANSPVQALEFTMSKWQGARRWELALQWEQIGDGTAQQGNPPTWRLWTGNGWQDTRVHQPLFPNRWHHLTFEGTISGSRVNYRYFQCDEMRARLDRSFPSVQSSDPDHSAVAVQLDGNATPAPYQVYLDAVAFDAA